MKKKKIEKPFFLVLAVLFLVAAIACFPWRPARFGTLFFGALAVGCVAEWVLLLKREENRICRILSVCGKVIFGLLFLSFIGIQTLIISNMYSDDVNAQYVFVLGARVYEDGRPSLTLKERLDVADTYLQQHPDAAAVLCGGQGDDEVEPEAVSMARYLEQKGIVKDRLLMEEKSRSTIQNIENARDMLDARGDGSYTVAVISSDFHLARARKLMQNVGLDAEGIPAQTPYLAQRIVLHCREYCCILMMMVTGSW